MFTRSTVFVLGKIVWMEMIKLNCFLLSGRSLDESP